MMIHFAIVGLLALLSIPSSVLAQSCTANPVAVQIPPLPSRIFGVLRARDGKK